MPASLFQETIHSNLSLAMASFGDAEFQGTILDIKTYAQIALALAIVISVVLLLTLIAILIFLVTTVRKQCIHLIAKLKDARRFVREEFSPTADEFLAVFEELKIKENTIIDLYTTFDSTRRRVVERWLKCDVSPVARNSSVFQSFLSESNFIKGAGFRMHRLLHENRIQTYPDGEEGRTILAPPFKEMPLRRVTVAPGAAISALPATHAATGAADGAAASPCAAKAPVDQGAKGVGESRRRTAKATHQSSTPTTQKIGGKASKG
uniref:Uncharacterized protein n=1 Tax=Romanomermis culicivorax TaxID=13658 RepID=A0A915JDX5_ROMCU